MVTYFDEDDRPIARVTVGGTKTQVEIKALIDGFCGLRFFVNHRAKRAGFDGEVCIPIPVATQLGLELIGDELVEYADGSVKSELLFSGTVVIDGSTTDVVIGLTESEGSLIGRKMFADKVLVMDFENRNIEVRTSSEKSKKEE